jgi:hypothetical protein
MSVFSQSTQQSNTAPALRVVTAPPDCASFTADQIQALDDASAAWERSGYSVALGEHPYPPRNRRNGRSDPRPALSAFRL